MSLFTTRVELHKASTEKDYEKLHEEMSKEGFSRTIRLSDESVTYHLPTAEYNRSSESLSTEDILKSAKKAANLTGKTSSILVTKSDGRRYWDNLTPVK